VKLEVKEMHKTPGLEEEFQFEESWDYLETGQGPVKFDAPVMFTGKAANPGDTLLVQGSISTAVKLKCNRCLKVFTHAIRVDYLEEFCTSKSTEDEDCILYDGEVIDFNPSVKENLVLALPMKWLCRRDCQGICPQCGQDLNVSQCNCLVEDVDPRMEVLKKFFEEKE